MGNKWNEFFEKQALEDMKATTLPNPAAVDVSETETEKAGENAEKALNEQNEQDETETKTEKKGTEENESSEQETGRKETEAV